MGIPFVGREIAASTTPTLPPPLSIKCLVMILSASSVALVSVSKVVVDGLDARSTLEYSTSKVSLRQGARGGFSEGNHCGRLWFESSEEPRLYYKASSQFQAEVRRAPRRNEKRKKHKSTHIGKGDSCTFFKDWHKDNHPNCNGFHEIDFGQGIVHGGKKGRVDHVHSGVKYIFHGKSRDAWRVNPSALGERSRHVFTENGRPSSSIILKRLLWEKDYRPEMYEHQRVDAVSTDKLTSSPHVIDIHGFCGASTLNELGNGGDLEQYMEANRGKISPKLLLQFARDAANGMADIHGTDGNLTTMVHHDVKPPNMLIVDGTLKFHDLNNAQFLKWDFANNTRCGFHWGHECGVDEEHTNVRAPEECREPGGLFSEKPETYRLGVVLYYLLTTRLPFQIEQGANNSTPADIMELLVSGVAPTLPHDVEQSSDPAIRAIRNSMKRAMAANIELRPRSRDIAAELTASFRGLYG